MELIIYITVTLLFTILLVPALLAVLILFWVMKAERKKLWPVMAILLFLTGTLGIWGVSHRSHPGVNDWAFLGKNITAIEDKYGKFEQIKYNEDGSGYAVLMTNDIVWYDVSEGNEYACYRMDFDTEGKIIKTRCEYPLGG